MHSKRCNKNGVEMGSHLLGNTLSPLGVSLGVWIFFFKMHASWNAWTSPKMCDMDVQETCQEVCKVLSMR